MSESSPFRAIGDNVYIWPPEPFETEREYQRCTKVISDGEPTQHWSTAYALSNVVDFLLEHREAIDKQLQTPTPLDFFEVDNEWWNKELVDAEYKDSLGRERNELEQRLPSKKLVTDRVHGLARLTSDEAIIKYLKALPTLHRNLAGRRGTAVHRYMERIVLGEIVDDIEPALLPWVENGIKFLDTFKPEFLEVESVVYSDRYGYAGSFDGLVKISTELMKTIYVDVKKKILWQDTRDKTLPFYNKDFITVLIDWKTAESGIKASTALQLAGYAGADFIGRQDGTKDPIPHIDEYWAISITDKALKVIPLTVNDQVFNHFLAIRETAKWMNDLSKKVLHKPLESAA